MSQFDSSYNLHVHARACTARPLLYPRRHRRVCSASRRHGFYSTVNLSEEELTLGGDTDVTEAGVITTGFTPAFVTDHGFLINEDA